MSTATASSPSPYADPAMGLMFRVADHLVPLFQTSAVDRRTAMHLAARAIEAYQPETQADFFNVARTIAFSLAALALLGHAAAPDLTMAQRVGVLGRANALNRSADQSERSMMQRRRHQSASAQSASAQSASAQSASAQSASAQTAPPPEPPLPAAETSGDHLLAAVAEAVQAYLTVPPSDETTTAGSRPMPTSKPAPPGRPVPSRPPPVDKPMPGPQPVPQSDAASTTAPPGIVPSAGSPAFAPAEPSNVAIRHSGPTSAGAQPPAASHRAELLRHTAMPRLINTANANAAGPNAPGPLAADPPRPGG